MTTMPDFPGASVSVLNCPPPELAGSLDQIPEFPSESNTSNLPAQTILQEMGAVSLAAVAADATPNVAAVQSPENSKRPPADRGPIEMVLTGVVDPVSVLGIQYINKQYVPALVAAMAREYDINPDSVLASTLKAAFMCTTMEEFRNLPQYARVPAATISGYINNLRRKLNQAPEKMVDVLCEMDEASSDAMERAIREVGEALDHARRLAKGDAKARLKMTPKPAMPVKAAGQSALQDVRLALTASRQSAIEGVVPEADETLWIERALCPQVGQEIFFPEDSGHILDAKKICARCEVRSECLSYALTNDEKFGIWGGLSERERRHLKRVAG